MKMELKKNVKTEVRIEGEQEEGMGKVKRMALAIKILSVILVLFSTIVLVYLLFFQTSNGPAASYNNDLEKLSIGRKSTSLDICNTIDDKDVRNTCTINVAENRMDPQTCFRIDDKNIRYVCLYRVAKRSNSKEPCEWIENANLKKECYKV